MKHVISVLILCVAVVFAEEFENPNSVVRPGTELQFAQDYLSFDFGESCSKKFIQCSDSVQINDDVVFNGIAYYSSLDTNFVVFVDFDASAIIIHYVHSGAFIEYEYPLKDILKQEFIHLQEWKVIQLSKDSAEHLIDRMIANMTSDSYDIVGVFYTHGIFCDTLWDCGASPVDGGAVMVPNWWTLLPDEKPTSISKTPIKNRFRLSRMNHETFFVEGINEATPYKVFDVNGILLKQGLVQNGVVQVPKTPSILDIAHQKFLLK